MSVYPTRSVSLCKLLIVASVFLFHSTNADALTCKRLSDDYGGFVSREAYDSWFPKSVTLSDRQFRPKVVFEVFLIFSWAGLGFASRLQNGRFH